MKDNLVQRCLDGDREAFSLLVEEYKAYVFAIILRFVQDKEMARYPQECFLRYTNPLIANNQNFKGWIGKITVNKTRLIGDTTPPTNCQGCILYQEHENRELGLWLQKERRIRHKRYSAASLNRMAIHKHYYQKELPGNRR